MEGCTAAPDLDYDDILTDPRGLFSQLWGLRCYLGDWRCRAGNHRWWGEQNGRMVIPIEDLVESDGDGL